MRLSKRLERVAQTVKSGGVVADVGCDHGFTSIYLVQHRLAGAAIAMDIGQGPLGRAAEHVEKYGMADRITLRLSDGLEKLAPGEADTILISGMGGALMAGILERGRQTAQAAQEMVLSPQSEIFLVRKKLHEIGFMIDGEDMVEEQGKYYWILRAVPGREVYREEEYIYGRKLVEGSHPVFREFLCREYNRLRQVELHMSSHTLSARGKEKLKKCLAEEENIQRLLNKM